MSVSITLTFRWPMGHRILGLSGPGAQCRNIHGHNWQAEIEFSNDDEQLEFGWCKSQIGAWIETNLDHGFLVGHEDPFAEYLEAEKCKRWTVIGQPTTEAVACLLAEQAEALTGQTPRRVHVMEGWTNAATWTGFR